MEPTKSANVIAIVNHFALTAAVRKPRKVRNTQPGSAGPPVSIEPTGSPVAPFQRLITPSAPPVSNVRLSGRNAADHTAKPGPANVRSSLRPTLSMTATERAR